MSNNVRNNEFKLLLLPSFFLRPLVIWKGFQKLLYCLKLVGVIWAFLSVKNILLKADTNCLTLSRSKI